MQTILNGKYKQKSNTDETAIIPNSIETADKIKKVQENFSKDDSRNNSLRKFVAHLRPNDNGIGHKKFSGNRFFVPDESTDATVLSPSDQYLADFSLLECSSHWSNFQANMVRLIPLANDYINDLDILPMKVYLTEEKLLRYIFERDKESYVYAYSNLLDFIRTNIWGKYLQPALEQLQKKFYPGSEEYKILVDQVLDKIINTFCLNSCTNEGEHNKVLISGEILYFEGLPKEIREYFSVEEIASYHMDYAKLLQLVEETRKINKDAQHKISIDMNALTEDHVDLSYHFFPYNNLMNKYTQYLTEHYRIKDKELKSLQSQFDKCKFFDIAFDLLAIKALEKQTSKLIPEFNSKPVQEKLYVNHKYLHGLFELISEQFLVHEKDACKVNTACFENFSETIAQNIVTNWLNKITGCQPSVSLRSSYRP